MKQKKYLIIGNSAAGIAAIRTLRNLEPHAQIICFSDEKESPYNKCFLADFISGCKQKEEIFTTTQEQLRQWNIDMRLGTRIVAIESDNNFIMTESGQRESYDALLLATGTRPFVPPIKNLEDCKNVISFHNLNSALVLERYLQEHVIRHVTVVGAGLSGIEVTDALIERGVRVSVVERNEQLLPMHLTTLGSHVLRQAMNQAGVQVMTHMNVQSVRRVESIADTIVLSDGSAFQTDLIIITAGVRRNDELACSAQLTLDEYGIVVDAYMQSSMPNIYAAGDIISIADHVSGKNMASCTWPDAMQQGKCAAQAMAGRPQPYRGAYVIASSAFFGMKFYSCGSVDSGYGTAKEQQGLGQYKRYVVQDGRLKGFQLLGSSAEFAQLRRHLLTGEPIDESLL